MGTSWELEGNFVGTLWEHGGSHGNVFVGTSWVPWELVGTS